MKNILIPTDFSNNAWHAIAYTVNFFKEETCNFFILHTYSPAFYRLDYVMGGPEFSAIPDVGVDISIMGLEKTLDDLQKHHFNPKHRYETISSFNTLTDEIAELVIKKEIDLIAMGTKGASGAKELFLGSNTVFVIRKATIPVMAIPEKVAYHPVRNILFPSDYLNRYKKEDLAPVLELARMHDANIMLMHVKEEPELSDVQKDNKAHLERCMEEISYRTCEVSDADMPEAVLKYIEEHAIDLLVMMNKHHSFFDRLLNRPNLDRIGFHVSIPLLVVPDSGENK